MRKIAKVTPDELNEYFCTDSVNLDAKLRSICNQFVTELQKVLNTMPHEKKVNLLKRRTLWYDSDLKEQRKVIRNCERF